MWLFSDSGDDPEDNALMQKHGAKALHSSAKSLTHAIQTGDEEAQHDVAQRMMQIAKHRVVRW